MYKLCIFSEIGLLRNLLMVFLRRLCYLDIFKEVFMKNSIIVFLLIMMSFSVSSVFATEEILSTTDNNDNNEIYNLVVNVDDNTQTLKELYQDIYINGTRIKREILNPKDLKSSSGMILERRNSLNVLNLKCFNFDNDRGGSIIVDTLYNAITGERRTIDLELAKDKNSWKLFKNKIAVSLFHIKVNKVIIAGTIGIKTIIME